jgi:hypothetical protein
MTGYTGTMRRTLERDDNRARQSLAARAPMKVRNGALLFAPKAGAKPDVRIVNKLRDGAVLILSDSRS